MNVQLGLPVGSVSAEGGHQAGPPAPGCVNALINHVGNGLSADGAYVFLCGVLSLRQTLIHQYIDPWLVMNSRPDTHIIISLFFPAFTSHCFHLF